MAKVTSMELAELWGRISKWPLATKLKVKQLLDTDIDVLQAQALAKKAEGGQG